MPGRGLIQDLLRLFNLVIFVVIAATGAARADGGGGIGDAKALLIAAHQAAGSLNYRGLVSYLKDDHMESLQVFHGLNAGVEQERLLSVNTPMREVIRTADKVTCYYPESKSISVDAKPARQSVLLNIPSDLNELSKYYWMTLGNVEHVASRPARIVSIDPKDDLRYGRKLWIDVESQLPIKFQWLDENRKVVEEMVFNSLTILPAIPAGELNPSTQFDGSWKVKQHETLPAESLNWSVEGAPEGFRMVSYSRLKRGIENRVIDHILLSDGISSVSIYIDQIMSEIFTAQPRKVGALNAYTRKIGNYLVTVMGEVPEKTVQAIGDGMRLQGSAAR